MAENPSKGEASEFLSQFNAFHVAVASLVVAILPLLLGLRIKTPFAGPLAVIVSLALLGISYFLWRRMQRERRDAAAREKRSSDWAERPLGVGFRRLYSYTRVDELPGRHRRQIARRIANDVAHPTFAYGVVIGDIGSGKSSVLDSGVAKALEAGGFSVVFLRGLHGLPDGPLDDLLGHIAALLAKCEKEPVLIFDQFEEALRKWPSPTDRQRLGEFLNRPAVDRHVRVLCGLRSDYMLALHDLRPALADPTSSKTLFPIHNFDEKEATEIILECAVKDGIPLKPSFAKALAADLLQGGTIRPPELQLVCAALDASDPESSYRLSGGAAGILSAYIEDAIESTSDTQLAKVALRSLCNFATLPPSKTLPKTIEQIVAAVAPDEDPNIVAPRLRSILGRLGSAGLINKTAPEDEAPYTLVHDYLVQPIALATAEETTETERATQFLRMHLAEYAVDPEARIPGRRLDLIMHHAERDMLMSGEAQDLIRRSVKDMKVQSYTIGGALCAFLLLSSVVLLANYTDNLGPPRQDGTEAAERMLAKRQSELRVRLIEEANTEMEELIQQGDLSDNGRARLQILFNRVNSLEVEAQPR